MHAMDWTVPEPRSGIPGMIDRLVGPGATQAEYLLQAIVPLLAATAAVVYARSLPIEWSLVQYIIAALLALDISGGVVTNATSTAKRWFHRAEQTRVDHLKFVSLHVGHLLFACALFANWNLAWLLINTGLLIAAALVILWSPLYLQRTVAYSSYALILVTTEFAFSPPVGLEWFLPLFYLKLLVSHLPLEAPFRPDS